MKVNFLVINGGNSSKKMKIQQLVEFRPEFALT